MRLMGLLAFALLVLVGVCGCACQVPKAVALHKSVATAATVFGNERTVLKYLTAALGPRQGVFRLYYHGPYVATGSWLLHLPCVGFPTVPVRPPPKGASGITAVRAIFRGDRNVVVMQGRRGMVRIYIGRVSPAILQTNLRRVKLDPGAQYSAALAIFAITGSGDVTAAGKQFGFRSDLYLMDVAFSGPAPGLPHLAARLMGVSVDRALDKVAKVFGGGVIYGECAQPDGGHLFDVQFDAVPHSPDE